MHIDTDGGEVSHAREMFKKVIDQRHEGLRMIAYVDFRAISAGAMIAYAHEEVYVAQTASVGDIGVIFVNREGKIEYAPEKIETVVRTLLVQAAEQNGWDRALLLKMTARNQKLYRAILPEGETQYVIEDDLPDFLLAHPELDAGRRAPARALPGRGPPPHPDRPRGPLDGHGDGRGGEASTRSMPRSASTPTR